MHGTWILCDGPSFRMSCAHSWRPHGTTLQYFSPSCRAFVQHSVSLSGAGGSASSDVTDNVLYYGTNYKHRIWIGAWSWLGLAGECYHIRVAWWHVLHPRIEIIMELCYRCNVSIQLTTVRLPVDVPRSI
jgi:hypothetical protein